VSSTISVERAAPSPPEPWTSPGAAATGRRTFSRLSSRAAEILDDGARRIFSFGAANQPELKLSAAPDSAADGGTR